MIRVIIKVMQTRMAIAFLLAGVGFAQTYKELAIPEPMPAGEAIVVGFLGAWERWDDPNRSVRKLVLKLKEQPGVHAVSCANHRRRHARKHILRALDHDRDGKVSAEEAASARIVLFGQSMGGGAVVKLANDLRKRNIPVLLTVQIDSWGLRDGLIPENVKAAANFYQSELLTIKGESAIRAANPEKTRILGNIRMHYPPFLPSTGQPEGILRRTFGGAHAKMEADPIVWMQVEALARAALLGGTFPVLSELPTLFEKD
jgi:hypothetical protein